MMNHTLTLIVVITLFTITVNCYQFPHGNYTPHGYIDNPSHSWTKRSGLIRSVPPIGYGFWATDLPFPCKCTTWDITHTNNNQMLISTLLLELHILIISHFFI
jgi:hypothetical protein